jgi:glycogen operon protein
MTTLLLSAGVPMILAGDEMGRSQRGNNNTYCQDNELSWVNWDLAQEEQTFLAFVKLLMEFRRSQPVFKRRKFFTGLVDPLTGVKDLTWFSPSGKEMTYEEWRNPEVRCLGACFCGAAIHEPDERGRTHIGDTILLLYNSGAQASFRLPEFLGEKQGWILVGDTSVEQFLGPKSSFQCVFHSGQAYRLTARSVAVFRLDLPYGYWTSRLRRN